MREKVAASSIADENGAFDLDGAEADVPTARMLSWARNSTLYRLSRRMITEHELATAIRRKAKEKFEGISDAQLQALAAKAIECGRQVGGLDDEAYAASKVRSGVRGGRSRKLIAQSLRQKGVSNDTASEALEDADDFRAALAYARKRGFGPFRTAAIDEKRLSRELASLAQKGFSLDIARRIIGMEREDAEEALQASPW